MRRVGNLEARGRTVTARLERGTVTLTPRGLARLRHPIGQAQFLTLQAKVAWNQPSRLRRTGWVYFDLGRDDNDEDQGFLVKYGPKAKQDFARLINAGSWQEEVRA